MTNPLSEKPYDSPLGTPPGWGQEAMPGEDVFAERRTLEAAAAALYQQGRNGANWFYWVAGLSLVNSAVLMAGGNTFFVIGLGVTLLADALAQGIAQQAPDIGQTARAVAFGFDLFIAAVIAGFGWLSGKRYLMAFLLGMGFYLLDGLLFVFLIQDWMCVAFHAFALFFMWKGFSAFRQLKALESVLQAQSASAPEGGALFG